MKSDVMTNDISFIPSQIVKYIFDFKAQIMQIVARNQSRVLNYMNIMNSLFSTINFKIKLNCSQSLWKKRETSLLSVLIYVSILLLPLKSKRSKDFSLDCS